MGDQENFERAKRIISTWPSWKRKFKLTKYNRLNHEA